MTKREKKLEDALHTARGIVARVAGAKKAEWDRAFGALLLHDVEDCHLLYPDAKRALVLIDAALKG